MALELQPGLEGKHGGDGFFDGDFMDTCWWASLGVKDITELAFILSKNALPLWENYQLSGDLKLQLAAVRNLPAETLSEIESFLKDVLDEIKIARLNDFFSLFVTPVIQIQDGDLKLPYEVKSAFLSVFNIVKGLLCERNHFVAIQCFSTSITRSLDAIKIGNLLSHGEISQLTRKYLLLSGKK